MIQRLQSVLFFFAAAVNIGILFTVISSAQNPDTEKSAEVWGTYIKYTDSSVPEEVGADVFKYTNVPFYQNTLHLAYVSLLFIGVGLLLFNIFQYHNRPFQIRMGYIIIIVTFLQILFSVFLSRQIDHQILPEGIQTNDPMRSPEFMAHSDLWWGFKMPIATVLLTFWGLMRVKKDEMIVKESSRLR